MTQNSQFKFLCVGAQKSGTTWLYHQLAKHPDVEMPVLKEIHYFDELERGVSTDLKSRFFDSHWMNKRWRKFNIYIFIKLAKLNFKEASWIYNYLYGKRNWEWYENLFGYGDKISGDITPDYAILTDRYVKEVQERYPDLKIIYLMRNPTERLWSQIKMVLGRKSKNISMKEYLEAAKTWDIEHCRYAETIDVWEKHFGKEQMFTGFYDDLKENPSELYANILDFLELPHSFKKEEANKVVYGGKKKAMPPEVQTILDERLKGPIQQMNDRFGPLPEGWLSS
ncbi:hypothetical protein VIBNISO65_750008 [Vibrio nigripulchritudo SO65]|uniref:sulfotransferase family protein n=1 Tax=Vibrio nigripulchritudo TaxID=28173 RepID=UPI0003B1ACB8|nr:sulfotransferase [Vibrio nigripulchritudo]CCN33630.1 hypothetical protein VIBNIAM115_1240008 [Vibrio nigripulchritudo AM115]CCN41998.1 hypothetical protein VIBNIFTn2_220009 [Vibrio nigripulchritudo FTn2]CCN67064.1 hypothetical protein VIBNIPon4_70008 [Vibrio nigripulchritudo POn4]CCN78773.1 hypothetical protein VIBNISO65_750008 [Vibrio nigripulchritudo SO65]